MYFLRDNTFATIAQPSGIVQGNDAIDVWQTHALGHKFRVHHTLMAGNRMAKTANNSEHPR